MDNIEGIIQDQTMNESLIDVDVATKVKDTSVELLFLEPKIMLHFRHQLSDQPANAFL
jgi:hypothetical protein